MTDHLITEIEIKDFKCFDHFKTEGLERVNLIGGKNNVGKTAFMEALLINVHAIDIKSLVTGIIGTKAMRETLNTCKAIDIETQKKYLEKNSKLSVSTNKKNIHFEKIEHDGKKEYLINIGGGETKKINANDLSFEINTIKNINFIDSFGYSNEGIIDDYSSLQKKDKEESLNDILMKLDSNIKSFKIIGETPQCKINNKYVEINDLGDGVRHLVSIVVSFYASENGYLFIDEIDNGIHYSMLDKIWEIILNLAEELNVQIFATTHSKECIESYGRVAKKLENKEVNFTTLVRNKSNEVVAINYDYDLLLSTLEQEHEVRGW